MQPGWRNEKFKLEEALPGNCAVRGPGAPNPWGHRGWEAVAGTRRGRRDATSPALGLPGTRGKK